MYNPRAELSSPDPAWLPGWDSLPQEDQYNQSTRVYGAMVQALTNRRWLEDCSAQYAERHAQYEADDEDFTAKIRTAREVPALHARIQALLELRGEVDIRFRHSGIDGATEHSHYVGPRYALELALAEEFATADLGRVYATVAPEEKFRDRMRPRLDQEEETPIYCAAAARGWIPDVPQGQLADDGIVRPVFTKAELGAIDAKITRERTAAAKRINVPVDDEPVIEGLDMALTAKDTEGQRTLGGTPPVEKVEWHGDTLIVTTSKEEQEQEIVGCKQTKDRVVLAQDGAQYDRSCKYRNRLTRTTITLAVPGMPKDVDIRRGDSLWLLGRVKKITDKTQHGKTTKRHIKAAIDVDYVYSVGRSGSAHSRVDFLPIAR